MTKQEQGIGEAASRARARRKIGWSVGVVAFALVVAVGMIAVDEMGEGAKPFAIVVAAVWAFGFLLMSRQVMRRQDELEQLLELKALATVGLLSFAVIPAWELLSEVGVVGDLQGGAVMLIAAAGGMMSYLWNHIRR